MSDKDVTVIKLKDLPEYTETHSYTPTYTSTVSDEYTREEKDVFLWSVPEVEEKQDSRLTRIYNKFKELFKWVRFL